MKVFVKRGLTVYRLLITMIRIGNYLLTRFHGGGGEGGREGEGTPYNGPYGEAPPERGTFFRLQVYERVGISLVEVFKRVGKSVIWVCKRAQKG